MNLMKMVIAFGLALSTTVFGSIALGGQRWALSPEATASCDVQLTNQQAFQLNNGMPGSGVSSSNCTFKTDGTYYQRAFNAKGIGGFYVNLTTKDTAAFVHYQALNCKQEILEENTKYISYALGLENKNYIDFKYNSPVCYFRFGLSGFASTSSLPSRVGFGMNYDLDY